jgi:hypothetical protein
VNFHSTQPTIRQNSNLLAALEFDLAEGTSHQLLGVERNGRHRREAGMLPYSMLPVFRINMPLTQSKIFLTAHRFRVLHRTLLLCSLIPTLGPPLLSLSRHRVIIARPHSHSQTGNLIPWFPLSPLAPVAPTQTDMRSLLVTIPVLAGIVRGLLP